MHLTRPDFKSNHRHKAQEYVTSSLATAYLNKNILFEVPSTYCLNYYVQRFYSSELAIKLIAVFQCLVTL